MAITIIRFSLRPPRAHPRSPAARVERRQGVRRRRMALRWVRAPLFPCPTSWGQREKCDGHHSLARAVSPKPPGMDGNNNPSNMVLNRKESAMSALTKLACPLAIFATFAFASAPAHAQFEGTGDQMAQFAPMMEQFAPMMEQLAPMMQMMKGKIGKKRMAQMMQMAGPMMSSMMASGGGDFTSMPGIPGMEGITGDGPTRQARKRRK
jgi:hypothetical protein